MASALHKVWRLPSDDGSLVFDERESLLTQLLDSGRAYRKKFLLHRLVVASGISASCPGRMELGAHWETLCHRVQRRHHGDVVTGLLLLYPTCALHIVECSSEALVTILQDLGGVHTPEHSPPATDARVLAVSHDLPVRLFLQWSCKALPPVARTLAGGSEREPTEKLVTDALEQLVQLSQHMLKVPKGSKVAMDTALDQVPELMVPQGVVEELLKREELLTPKQYLEVYHSPLNALGDSGRASGHIFSSNFITTV
ncbi:testis-expressed protein 47 isoform X2 [Brienomyrus brachyistius]|uniref:testis-expressed protein 47 isoform X2 n=1 Tax=Brienomyrus brachyistius TaxID=42636 RepID=UPI0020B244F1|nr:testis-expressed protein 47 isoform X2 [Brienomyrus brachyistius]